MRKKILFIATLLLMFVPINTYAAETTDKLYINMDIREDGSLYVEEIATLSGDYNGRLRNIDYRNSSAPTFTGTKQDFTSSDIYNGSSITDIKVGSINNKNKITFDSFKSSVNYFTETTYADSGDDGVYTLDNTTDGIDLKIFNPSSNNSAFYISYVVKDVVVVHNDVAELAWNIFGSNYEENIDDLEVHVNLPREDPTLRLWLRGDLAGNIKNVNNRYALIKYDFLGAYNPTSVRMMFDKSIVSSATKFSNVNGKNYIMEVEQEAADKANAERKKIKFQNNIVIALSIIWYIVIIVLIVLFRKKKKENDQSDFNIDYLREFPASYGPEVVEYLNKRSVSTDSLSATIMMLLEKKALTLVIENDDDYIFTRNDKVKSLTATEEKAIDLLIKTIGDGTSVKLSAIKSFGKKESDAKTMIEKYDDWKNDATAAGVEKDFFLKNVPIKNVLIIVGLLGAVITIFNTLLETGFIVGYLAVGVGVGVMIFAATVIFRTKNGVEDYKKWQALKKFMQDFGTMDEKSVPEVSLWGKYLVYALVLGCADKLEKDMKIRIDNMSDATRDVYYGNNYYYFYNRSFIGSTISHSINNGIHSAITSSRSTIASSQMSSGSGFGGGASGGGGSFGGGGGGGRF